jgi:hypothetical protein
VSHPRELVSNSYSETTHLQLLQHIMLGTGVSTGFNCQYLCEPNISFLLSNTIDGGTAIVFIFLPVITPRKSS